MLCQNDSKISILHSKVCAFGQKIDNLSFSRKNRFYIVKSVLLTRKLNNWMLWQNDSKISILHSKVCAFGQKIDKSW